MGQKLHPTSLDWLVHPGESIAEAIEDRGLTQKELALRTGFTEKHISTVINGIKSISAKLALGLEKALDIPATFWKNLQANYELELESFNEINNITEAELEIAKEITKPIESITGETLNDSNNSFKVWSLRNLLGVSNLTAISKLNAGFYRVQASTGTNEKIMYAWQYLSEKECENQTDLPLNIDLLKSKLEDIKAIMFQDATEHINLIRDVLNSCGVLFTVKKHVTGLPIHGLTVKTRNNKVMIAMTIRNKYVDTFWFSLFHEIAHVINNDFLINHSNIQTMEKIEENANDFASNILIDQAEYERFISNKNFSNEAILSFSEKINVLPGIVSGRLMNDNVIDWSNNIFRTKYEWID